MDYKDLAELIFPDVKDISYYEEKYITKIGTTIIKSISNININTI